MPEPETTVDVRLQVNGRTVELRVRARELLVDTLRRRLDLKSVHIGCDTSNCGACTVLLGGYAVKSCTMLTAAAADEAITTLEGLGDDVARRLRRKFVEHHALQCGYCTPGMLLVSHDVVRHRRPATREELRHLLAGNLCRCTGYLPILAAVWETLAETEVEDEGEEGARRA